MEAVTSILPVLFYHLSFGVVHELSHVAAGMLLGCKPAPNWIWDCFCRRVCIPDAAQGWREPIVRHAGWIGSLLVFLGAVQADLGIVAICVAGLTVIEAVASDMCLLFCSSKHSGWFFCGNFGMVLVNAAWTKGSQAMDILEKMVQVTMMRGAQSGGVVTYVQSGRRRSEDLRGVRARVVNSKRSDLSKLVRSKLSRVDRWARITNGSTKAVRLYAGHTRFATSSKASFDGTHPHQWSPPARLRVYSGFDVGTLTPETRNHENYICHNGDLDFFDVCGRTYDLEAVQPWLVRATGHPMPSSVDSCAIAGLMDLLRTQGSWFLSVRFGFLFCAGHKTLDYKMPKRSSFEAVAKQCEAIFEKYFCKNGASAETLSNFAGEITDEILALPTVRTSEVLGLSAHHFDICIRGAVAAFFDNDLLQAARIFMGGAKGSFGLCVTSSLDAHSQMVLAARGQTMSIAFYPEVGLVLYGSEQAAVKAGVGITPPGGSKGLSTQVTPGDPGPAVRLDLDDLGGELCLLDWGPIRRKASAMMQVHSMMGGAVQITLCQDSTTAAAARLKKSIRRLSGIEHVKKQLEDRLVPLDGNPLVLPLPATVKDPVACDLAEIPRVLARIQNDWKNGGESLNRLTAWNLGRQLKSRLLQKSQGLLPQDAVDILITGCEVSLWLGEQFAADLTLAFKKLNVRTIAANKVLGEMGQKFKVPQFGHQFSEGQLDLTDAIVLIVSHSGGTFSSLNVSNLLQSVSRNLFVLTSEWDTQIGKQLRKMKEGGEFFPRIFSTDIGVRPAEPCSISVAATHQMLTQIFEYIALVISNDSTLREYTGCVLKDSDLHQLARCNRDNIGALEDIVGVDVNGKALKYKSTAQELRKKGAYWAQHVLENPRAWGLCAIYILVSVILGKAPVTSLCQAGGLEEESPKLYITRSVDALIYLFLPQLFILLIRLVQGRFLLHRMVGRTVVIGDCPWVAQCAEAFLSKLFACSYSATGISVFSGNPADHLVHRMTHRVVRGSLLAVGRPDGRLSALCSLENSVCLSVNQASSIQSISSTCESLTLGHNPYSLPLSKHSVFLKGNRPDFLCERLLRETRQRETQPCSEPGMKGSISADSLVTSASKSADWAARAHTALSGNLPKLTGMSSAALSGEYSNLFEFSDCLMAPIDRLDQLKREKMIEEQVLEGLREIDGDGHGVDFHEFATVCFESGKQLHSKVLQHVLAASNYGDEHPSMMSIQECEKLLSIDFPNAKKLSIGHHEGDTTATVSNVAMPSRENYFGEELRHAAVKGTTTRQLVESQELSMQLYESRIASLQRAVAFFVLFHEMGKQVADFWPRVSFGLLGYRMDRTHSIMRIATTASPVSGADVRAMMTHLSYEKAWKKVNSLMSYLQKNWRLRSKAKSYRQGQKPSKSPNGIDYCRMGDSRCAETLQCVVHSSGHYNDTCESPAGFVSRQALSQPISQPDSHIMLEVDVDDYIMAKMV